MATTIENSVRIGLGAVEIDEYGGDFSAALLDLGRVHPEGITVNYEKPFKELGAGQSPMIEDIYDIALQRLEFTFMAKVFSEKTIALSMGLPITSVTDNTGGTPPSLQVNIGGFLAPTYYALRIKMPQVVTPTLFDIIQCHRVRFVAAYTQILTYENERYVPLRAICTRDATLGTYAKLLIEGAGA